MPVPPANSHFPPPDLDVPAARSATRTYGTAVRRGVAPTAAWATAVEVFALHHPAWPWPMAEREAARTVGVLLAREAAAGAAAPPPHPAPPMALLRALANLVVPGVRPALTTAPPSRSSPFRRAWRLSAAVPPMGVPPLRLPPGASPHPGSQC